MQHIAARDFNVLVGPIAIQVESMTATISDNRAPVFTRGIPSGYTDGDVSCSGQIVVDAFYFNLLSVAAGIAGSWRELKPFDINAVAVTTSNAQAFTLYGCLFKISELLNLDPNASEKTKVTLAFDVTDPDFVKINGVSYLSSYDTRLLF